MTIPDPGFTEEDCGMTPRKLYEWAEKNGHLDDYIYSDAEGYFVSEESLYIDQTENGDNVVVF